MKGGDLLTPKTVSVIPITNYDYQGLVPPLALGSYIYFPFTRDNFTGIREFTVNSTTDTYDSTEITEHVPAYIPKNVYAMAGTTAEDTIAVLSQDEPSSLYIYNYFWSNNQKVLSSWNKYTFTENIKGIKFIDSTLHMVTSSDTQTHLVELPFASVVTSNEPIHLDMNAYKLVTSGTFKFTNATGASASFNNLNYTHAFTHNSKKGYDSESTSDNSQWLYSRGQWYLYIGGDRTYAVSNANYADCPWDADWTGTDLQSASFVQVGGANKIHLPYKARGTTGSGRRTTFFSLVEVYRNDGTQPDFTVNDDVIILDLPVPFGTYLNVGMLYTMKYTFSEQLFKAKAGNGSSPSNSSNLRIKNGSIYYDNTAHFQVKVTPEHRETYVNTFSPMVIGSSIVGTLKLESGFYRFPVFTKAQGTIISIENDSAFPSTFQSAEFESFVNTRSERYG